MIFWCFKMAIARPCTVLFESFELRLARCQRARAPRTCQEDKHNSHVESLRCVNWDGCSNKQGSFSHSLGKYSLSAALPRGSMTVDSVSIQPSKRQLPITEVDELRHMDLFMSQHHPECVPAFASLGLQTTASRRATCTLPVFAIHVLNLNQFFPLRCLCVHGTADVNVLGTCVRGPCFFCR